MSLRRPEPVDVPVIAAAASVWLGILASWHMVVIGVIAAALWGAVGSGRPRRSVAMVVAVGLAIGACSGSLVEARRGSFDAHDVGPGRIAFTGVALTDAGDDDRSSMVVAPDAVRDGRLPDLPVLVERAASSEVETGERLSITGRFVPRTSVVSGRRVAGTVFADRIDSLGSAAPPHQAAANAMRTRIREVIDGSRSDARALVAGFLIGDTSDLSPIAVDRMRLAGLAHFVAVSGSNVALFLGLWWIVLAPLRLGAWWRAGLGIVGLLVFGALTRWEPSVVRASACAAALLVGRAAGVPVSGWSALGSAVTLALILAGELASNLGFQLSVLATIGVMAASGVWSFRPRWAATALGATVGAQVAVAPVLVGTFGSLPLLAPLTNIVSMPLVTVATATGGVGAIVGWGPLVEVAAAAASGVLAIAAAAASWPQIGLFASAGIVGVAVAVRWSSSPALALGVTAVVVAVAVWPRTAAPDELPAVIFLDVGQGDAALVLTDDATVMIDAGPDPVLLARKLERYGVRRIDLAVATHVHADHLDGFEAVLGRVPVGAVAFDFGTHNTGASRWFESEIARLGIPILRPEPGLYLSWPELALEFEGPRRRYESPNDQSVVVLVETAGRRFAFPGDIEVHAQGEIDLGAVSVLKVPHQGAATSDLAWLRRHAGEMAVVSVGPNDYGHPADDVLEALLSAGSEIHRTDLDGDVVVSARSGP